MNLKLKLKAKPDSKLKVKLKTQISKWNFKQNLKLNKCLINKKNILIVKLKRV